MKDAHRALREGTRAEHERLDTLLGGFDLANRDSYRRFLLAHAEALLPIEAALDRAAGQVVADWPARRRGPALAQDLATLGTVPIEPGGVFKLDDAATTAGALYVIEGSRLGGRFLVRQVGAGLPTAYLGDEQPRGRWPALLAALDRVLLDEDSQARAITAACATFARFETAARRHIDASLCASTETL